MRPRLPICFFIPAALLVLGLWAAVVGAAPASPPPSAAASPPPSATASPSPSATPHGSIPSAGDDLALLLDRLGVDPALSDNPSIIDRVAREAESYPVGRVRVQARMIVAEAWLGRMHRPEDALEQLRKVVADREADNLSARFAERQLVQALVSEDRLSEAADEASAHGNLLEQRFSAYTHRLLRRHRLSEAAIVELFGFIGLAAVSLVRAGRHGRIAPMRVVLRRVAPLAVAFAIYVGAVGGVLASRYENGNSAPFFALGAAILPIILVARVWAAVGSRRAGARIARAALSATSVFAAALVLLETINPTYLDSFGL